MNFLADESVDRQTVAHLRNDGHAVIYVAETNPGAPDETVLGLANQRKCVLITADHDFGEMVFRQGLAAEGVVLVRLFGLSPTTKASIVSTAVAQHAPELSGAFSVVTPGFVRIRRMTD